MERSYGLKPRVGRERGVWEVVGKRVLDVAGALVGLVLGAPLFLVIGFWVWWEDRGPVLFRQPRLGLGGKPFVCLKFRTMKVNAPDIRNADGSTFNSADDPRVTRAGRFLRRTSLDELPQFWNVLVGEMSLVGPRPDLVSQRELYEGDEAERLLVKPGVTGLAQISGRNTIDWATRKALDVGYAREWSLGGDLRIIWRTVGYVLARRGVYQDGGGG